MSNSAEQRIRQILSSSPAIIYTRQAHGDYAATFVSDNFTARFGYSVGEFLNQPDFWKNNIHPEDQERVFSAYDDLFSNGRHVHEYRFQKKDGSYLWIHDELQLICDDDGKPVEIIGSWLDITDRKEAEVALQKSNVSFREFFENNPIPTIISSIDGVILQVNRAFLDSSGYLQSEVLGVLSQETFWADSNDREVMIAAIKKDGYINDFECTFLDKAQNPRHCLLSSRALEIDGELKILNTLVDMTERDRARTALLKSEQLFKDFFTSNPIATIISSQEGHIHMVNAAFTKTTGYPSDEVVGRTVQEMNFWRDLEDRKRMVAMLQEHGFLNNFESRFYGKNDRAMTCLISSCMIDHEGEARILSIVIDVSEQRKAEEETKKLEQAKSDFISMAAHELRTPLIAIIGYCELLENVDGFNLTANTKKEYLDIIHSNAEVLNTLVDDLLDMGRIQIGRSLGIVKKETELRPLIDKIVASARLKSIRHEIVIEECEGVPTSLWIDPGRITQVLHNLLSNAIKFSPDGGVVKLVMAGKRDCAHISVVDNGIGLSPEQLERVFERFYRVDTENSKSLGLGLGLSISKQIINDHGGELAIDSSIGQGTTVTLKLPLT